MNFFLKFRAAALWSGALHLASKGNFVEARRKLDRAAGLLGLEMPNAILSIDYNMLYAVIGIRLRDLTAACGALDVCYEKLKRGQVGYKAEDLGYLRGYFRYLVSCLPEVHRSVLEGDIPAEWVAISSIDKGRISPRLIRNFNFS